MNTFQNTKLKLSEKYKCGQKTVKHFICVLCQGLTLFTDGPNYAFVSELLNEEWTTYVCLGIFLGILMLDVILDNASGYLVLLVCFPYAFGDRALGHIRYGQVGRACHWQSPSGVELLLCPLLVVSLGNLHTTWVSVSFSIKWETIILTSQGHCEAQMRSYVELAEHQRNAGHCCYQGSFGGCWGLQRK